MKVTKTDLPEVLIIAPKIFGDSRGFFYESFQAERFAENGINLPFVQDNVSRSKKNILRGLHYQKNNTQGKLVFVTRGRVFDVAVDIRKKSKNFGKWTSVILDDKDSKQIYIPPGFAHGFCVLSDEADFIYKCTNYYDPKSEMTIIWNDKDLSIPWPVKDPILSQKDLQGKKLKDLTESELL